MSQRPMLPTGTYPVRIEQQNVDPIENVPVRVVSMGDSRAWRGDFSLTLPDYIDIARLDVTLVFPAGLRMPVLVSSKNLLRNQFQFRSAGDIELSE